MKIGFRSGALCPCGGAMDHRPNPALGRFRHGPDAGTDGACTPDGRALPAPGGN
jgi:hypothetical protein